MDQIENNNQNSLDNVLLKLCKYLSVISFIYQIIMCVWSWLGSFPHNAIYIGFFFQCTMGIFIFLLETIETCIYGMSKNFMYILAALLSCVFAYCWLVSGAFNVLGDKPDNLMPVWISTSISFVCIIFGLIFGMMCGIFDEDE